MPSGGDDTQPLQDAFADAMLAGPGSVVQLCEGEYHIGYLEVYDFCGSLKGAGKGKTIFTAIGGLDIDALWANHLMPFLVKFVGGDVNLSHFTMRPPPGSLSTGGPGMGLIYSLLNFSSINAVYEPYNEDRSINVVIDNVCFKGQLLEGGLGYVNGHNSMMAVRTGFDFYNWSGSVPREKIDFKITNSEFDTFVYGIGLETTKNSKLIVGEKNKGNTFRNLDQLGGIWDFRDVEVMVEGNTFNILPFGNGLDLDDFPYYPFMMNEAPTNASLFNVQFNTFNLNHSQYALWLRNVRRVINPEEIPIVFQVKSNNFRFTDNFDWGIIDRVQKELLFVTINLKAVVVLEYILIILMEWFITKTD